MSSVTTKIYFTALYGVLTLYTIVETLISKSSFQGHHYYFIGLMLITTCVNSYLLKSHLCLDSFKINIKDKNFLGLLAIIVITLVFSVLGADINSIWLDEYTQHRWFLNFDPARIVEISKNETQPPLGYLISALNYRLLGLSEFKARLPSILSSSFALGLVFVLLRKLKVHFLIALFAIFAAYFNLTFIRYAVEARPLGVTLLAEGFFLIFLFDALKSKKNSDICFVFTSALVMLLTLNLQPIALAVTIIAIAIFGYFKIATAVTSAVLLFIPIGLNVSNFIYKIQSDRFNGFKIQEVFNAIIHFRWSHVLKQLQISGFYFYLFATLMVLYTLMRIKKKENFNSAENFFSHQVFIYPLIFTFIFNALIRWKLNIRYIIIYIPLVFIFIAITLNNLKESFKVKDKWTYLLFLTLIPNIYSFKSHIYKENQIDWRPFYKFTNQIKEPTLAITFVLHGVDYWYPDFFIAKEFYSQNTGSIKFYDHEALPGRIDYSPANLIMKLIKSKENPQNLLLIQGKKWSLNYFITREHIKPFPNISYKELSSFHLLQIKNVKNIGKTFEELFQHLLTIKEDYLLFHFRLLEYLIVYYRHEKRTPEMNAMIKRYKSLNYYDKHLKGRLDKLFEWVDSY